MLCSIYQFIISNFTAYRKNFLKKCLLRFIKYLLTLPSTLVYNMFMSVKRGRTG